MKSALSRFRHRLRRTAGAFMIDGAFNSLARVGRMHPKARPERHQVEVLRDIAYAPDHMNEHLLDIYRPTSGPGPFPVVFYVHGGGFRILSKDTHWIMGLAFARQGYLVVSINYRLAPRYRYPAAIEDACNALAWTWKHIGHYGGDRDRLILAGESAGANLTASLAIATSYRRPEPWARQIFDLGVRPVAAIPACGILQVTDVDRFRRRRPLSAFLYDRLDEVSRAYLGSDPKVSLDLADPLLVLERGERPERPLPRFFSFAGTKDVLLDDTRRLHAALGRLGVPSQVAYYPGELHAFHALIWRPQAVECWRTTFAFLTEALAQPIAQASAG